MLVCPEKEILSAYYDGEILSPWKEKIAEHEKTCTLCQQNRFRHEKLKNFLHSDLIQVNLTQNGLEESFKRLNAHMKFMNVTSKNESPLKKQALKYVFPAMAAAAVFAFALPVLPFFNNVTVHVPNFTLTKLNQTKTLPKNSGVISDGSVTHAELAAIIGQQNEPQIQLSLRETPLIQSNVASKNSLSELEPRVYSIGEIALNSEPEIHSVRYTSNLYGKNFDSNTVSYKISSPVE